MPENKFVEPRDTIAALATPVGRGGVAIVRVSGPAVKDIIQHVLGKKLSPREAYYLPFFDADGNTIDVGIAIFFPAPASFTGEDVVEFHGHGGPVVVDLLLQRTVSLGARLARPGEFSERAFLNNKMDLTQAEAIADLIDASTAQAARLAMRSLQGEFSKKIHELTEKIIYLRMYIESAIDFAEEEIDFLSDEKIHDQFKIVQENLMAIHGQAKQGSLLREGITAVIVGAPNVGKSSLLNCLSGKNIAIVTHVPGTTRDVLRDYLLIDGMPLHIVDTAGLRESDDIVEQEGIKRAYVEIEKADIILYVSDAAKEKQIDFTLLPQAILSQPIIFIHNKSDLLTDAHLAAIRQDKKNIYVSAKSGQGIDVLKDRIKLLAGFHNESEGIFLARRRHLDALARASDYIQAGHEQLLQTKSGELVAEDLRLAQHALNEITGEFSADDLLGKIFANFCIGK